jgi:hypothetical protein
MTVPEPDTCSAAVSETLDATQRIDLAKLEVHLSEQLRDYFALENFHPDSVVANHQLAANTILAFSRQRRSEKDSFANLEWRRRLGPVGRKKASKPPPLTLELSYIEDAAHPDVFKIGRGQF